MSAGAGIEKPASGATLTGQRAAGPVPPEHNDTTRAQDVKVDSIPGELKEREQWVCWRYMQKPGADKSTKVPFIAGDSKQASSTDPSTWRPYKLAIIPNGRIDGIGYVLNAENNDAGVDLDDCIEDGMIQPWAWEIIQSFNSYTEVSPSGDGVKIFLKGRKPGTRCKSGKNDYRPGQIEVYDKERFFTVTGRHVPGTPLKIHERQAELESFYNRVFTPKPNPERTQPPQPVSIDDAELIQVAKDAKNGEKFTALWDNGDISGYPSHSEADLALCSLLAFYTGNDAARIDRLFRQSKLMRDKWKRDDYREPTIQEAMDGTTEFYTPPRKDRDPTPTPQEPPAFAEAFDQVPTPQEPPTETEAEQPPPTVADWPLFTLTDAYKPRKPLEYVVDGLFSLPSLSIVYGAPGCLKSLLLLDMAVCVAAGVPWLEPLPENESIARKTSLVPIMYLDFDNGALRTHERVEALARARNLEPDAVPFYYVSMPAPWLDGNDMTSIDGLVDLALSKNIGLIVVDNLGSVSGDADENSAQMVQVMGNFRRLAELTEAAAVVVHHQRKATGYNARAGDTLRGHSSIEAAIDLGLLVEREEGKPEVTIKSTKTRGVDVAPFGALFAYDWREGTTELERARFYGVPVEDNSRQARATRAILEAVENSDETLSKGKLAAAAKVFDDEIGTNYYRTTIDGMVASGALAMKEGQRGAKQYSLPEIEF